MTRDECPPRDVIRRLLDQAGLVGGEFVVHPLPGGGNNRVYRLAWSSPPRERVEVEPRRTPPADAGGSPMDSVLLKAYFRHPGDKRDRLKVEYDFTTFAWQHGVRRVPRPLAWDPQSGLGLYEFVEGRRLEPSEVDEAAVAQALAFYRELNRHRQTAEALKLPAGSEACFCLADHLGCVERRLARCEAWQPGSELDNEALAFVNREVLPRWRQIRADVETAAGPDAAETLPASVRRLSPSDFGFHNALVESSGQLRFVDFEYAGWDDPAKLACDFFCQPALPAPGRCWDAFLAEIVADLPDPAQHRQRTDLLLPVYRMKWITIMLNDFQPAGDDRRRFARPGQDPQRRKAEQLAKAKESLCRLNDPT